MRSRLMKIARLLRGGGVAVAVLVAVVVAPSLGGVPTGSAQSGPVAVSPVGPSEGVAAGSASDLRDVALSGLPDPVFAWDGGIGGHKFDRIDFSAPDFYRQRPNAVSMSSDDVDKVASLSEGTIVVEFSVSGYDKPGRIFCGRKLSRPGGWPNGLCLEVETENAGYKFWGVFDRNDDLYLREFDSKRAPVSERVTVVLSVSSDGNAFMVNNHESDVHRHSDIKFFSYFDIDTLMIGGVSWSRNQIDSTVYSLEVYDTPFSVEQARDRIRIPRAVFAWDSSGDESGDVFDGRVADRSDDLDAVRDLDEGSIVVSFETTEKKTRHGVVCASNNREASSGFCFTADKQQYGAYGYNNGEAVNTTGLAQRSVGAGPITAVLSVSRTDGTFVMSSQDPDDIAMSKESGFFSSVEGLNKLLIGGLDDNQARMRDLTIGHIYSVTIFDTPMSKEQARLIVDHADERSTGDEPPIEDGRSYDDAGPIPVMSWKPEPVSGDTEFDKRIVDRTVDLKTVRGLTEGSIVVSFEITEDKPRHNIVCASNNRDLASQYCFSVDQKGYGAHAHNDGEVITTATVEAPTVGAGRISCSAYRIRNGRNLHYHQRRPR